MAECHFGKTTRTKNDSFKPGDGVLHTCVMVGQGHAVLGAGVIGVVGYF